MYAVFWLVGSREISFSTFPQVHNKYLNRRGRQPRQLHDLKGNIAIDPGKLSCGAESKKETWIKHTF